MKIALFGDVGGHYSQFAAALEALGCIPESGKMPKNLAIIQVGDLIHKGPGSNEVVEMVDRFLTNNEHWYQMFGNHEGQYVGGPEFWEDPHISSKTKITLNEWFTSGETGMAVGFWCEQLGETLVTHAGVTPWFWSNFLNSETNLKEAVFTINELPTEIQFLPGYMLGGEPLGKGGPAWAHVSLELYLPWSKHKGEVPWSQVHGHTSSVWWDRKQWSPGMEKFAKTIQVDQDKRQSVVEIGGKKFVSIDPGFGKYAPKMMYPFVVQGEIL